jgi:serine/threonine-protein kinase HipA
MYSRRHGVLLGQRRIGVLHHKGDVVRFTFDDDYWDDPDRDVLGLWFEDNPGESPRAALRLPPWYSNLLPEGVLREWIAKDRGVSAHREVELLLQVGLDLSGAVVIVEDGGDVESGALDYVDIVEPQSGKPPRDGWKFSLAGIGMKFSMVASGQRLTLPASNEYGDWIVKLPHANHSAVPFNEFKMMSLAGQVGIDVPEIRMVSRSELPDLPEVAWPNEELWAYAIERFDRTPKGGRIHIEDFAQVRGFYPEDKYNGSFETVAALAYRRFDTRALHEVVRRITFNLLIGNGDAHLKNWSLIYPDGRNPTLSPAYDIVSTAGYYPDKEQEHLGLKLGGTRVFDRITKHSYESLGARLGVDGSDLVHTMESTVRATATAWANLNVEGLPGYVVDWISSNIEAVSGRMLR